MFDFFGVEMEPLATQCAVPSHTSGPCNTQQDQRSSKKCVKSAAMREQDTVIISFNFEFIFKIHCYHTERGPGCASLSN